MLSSATLTRPDSLPVIGRYTAPKPGAGAEEDMLRLTTTDGSVMSHHAGTKAVRSGAGIFLGGYFVGVAEESLLTELQMPFIRY